MPIVLDNIISSDNLVNDALKVIRIVRPTWKPNEVESKVFTAGLMNTLVGFFIKGKFNEDVVMVKIYGNNTEAVIDREAEINSMMLLHNQKCGSELYAVFKNGICYEFIHGVTLNEDTCKLKEIYILVATELAKVHTKTPIMESKSLIWRKLRDIQRHVGRILESDESMIQRLRNTTHHEIHVDFGNEEINELEILLEGQSMPVVFCHNDLLMNNIVYNKTADKISFIDFEYAMPNYAPFDVANHFNEFAGIDKPDFSKCPTDEFKLNWIKLYLEKSNDTLNGFSPEEFLKWVKMCSPVSHLLWALWAITQAHNSTIHFNYIGYFGLRYAEYLREIKEIRQRIL